MRSKLSLALIAACAALLVGSCVTAPAARPAPTPAAKASPEAAATPEATSSPDASPSPSPAAALQPIAWTDDAKAAFEAEVPALVKKIARKSMEKKARERSLSVIDMDFYNEIKKEQMGQ